MKKLNKFFAILFAVLGVTTLKAQTDVTSLYLTNADFSSTTGWTAYVSNQYKDYGNGKIGGKLGSYAASTTDASHLNSEYFFGFQCRWSSNYASYNQTTSEELPAGVYTLSYDVENVNGSTSAVNYNNLFYVKVGDKTFTDTSVEWMKGKSSWTSHSITFVITEATKATVSLGYGTGSNNLDSKNTPVLYVSHLKLTYRGVDDINADNPADFTSLIKNPSFETGNLDGWTYKSSSDTGVKPNSDNTYKTSGVDGNYLYNTWWQGTPLTQTVGNIPNGIYELKALLASDQNAKLFLLANDEHSEVYTITTDNKTFHDVSYEFKVLNGQAKIGVVGGNDAGEYLVNGHWWYKADNFRLIYKGADLSIEREALDAALAKARAIDQATIPTVVAVSLNSAISTAENVENALNPIKAATNALLAVLATVDVVQAPYIETKALITSSNNMLTNSTASDADKATFQGVINKAEENLNDATDKATIDAIAVTIMDAQKAYCLVASPTEGHPFDMTHLIVNPKFDEGTKGWTHTTGAPNWGIATNQGGAITGNYFENWKWESYTGDIYQEITGLPNGKYRLTVAAFRDQLIDGASDGDAVYVFANDMETLVNAAAPAFYTVEVTTTTGSLKFGVRSKVAKYRWMGIDNATLLFVAGLDLSEFEAAYNTALEAAIAARDNVDYQSVAGIERTNLVNAINLTVEETKESYMEATSALNEATAAFIAAKSDYETLNSEITIAKGLGMTDAAINAITNNNTGAKAFTDLKVAEYNYIQGTYTERATLESWTETFAEDLDGEGYKTGGPKYFNEWGNATRTAKQTVKLPAGDYAISSIGRGQVGTSGYLYYKIGETTNKVDFIMKGNRGLGVDVNGVANFSVEGEYNCNGEGFGWEYRFITFHLDAETEVEIGVSATFANAWVSIYAPELLTTEASVKALRLSEIATALGNVPTGKMDATVQTELNDAVAAAENVTSASTIDELNSVSTALAEAIANAKVSVADYAAIKTYIEKADKIDASIAASYKSQYDNGSIAETATNVFQTLEVATYNYVTEEFSYPVALSGDWTTSGPVGELSDQHWSGEKRLYMEQSSAAWGSNAWEISYDQDLTLPAGEYVFKVAGRKASGDGCTLELIVTKEGTTLGTVNDFPEGDTGLGINKNGVTSFDANDEAGFANNNAGRAWQWRYVKFTLGEAATVNIAVKAKATTTHQWISFCDATVQMTEETYLEANKGGLDAPTAAANALVDTKPMGTAENQALKDALALPVTTGAELQAKINALNTAVANANAWVAAYNGAKAPLVAALERFETDYNKDGVKMSQTAWNNILDEVKDAALAKDVTNSYEGFADAAEELNAALDVAQASINAYAALNAAIEQAETLASANVGDKPFQRPVSAQNTLNAAITVAQDAYDAAEDDATGVKSTLDTAVEAFNNAELNKPEADEAFNIVLVYANYEFDGKAMTYIANDRKDHGLYNIKYKAEPNANYAQAFTLTPITDKVNHYTLSMTDVDGNERYVCTGTVYGGNASQIRTTTDAAKALAVKVIATSTDGIWNLYNTEAEQYIGSQDEGVYTVNSHIDFNIVKAEKADVTLNISSAGWATLILPFNAEIPEGVTVYASESVEGELVKLTEVGSIVANTPYLIKGTAGEYNFYGYGLADKNEYKDANELFVGTYVDYKTEGGEYVLQNHEGKVAFYRVGEYKPEVAPYRCYLTVPATSQAKAFFFDNEATGINGVDTADAEIEAIYTINGTRVNNLQKGLNIVKMSNGKTQKVYVK